LLGVRQGNYGAIPADAGASRAVPGMLPAEAAGGIGVVGFFEAERREAKMSAMGR
jgi:hypothetical protein